MGIIKKEPGQVAKAFKKATREGKRILVTSRVEVAIGVAVFGVGAGFVSHNHYEGKAGQIPVAYSQVSGDPEAGVNPLTQFYAGNNDAAMMIFEANDDAFKAGYDNEAFAKALENTIKEAEGKHDFTLAELAESMPGYTDAAMDELFGQAAAGEAMPAIADAFDDTWTASHIDHYRTETYTTNVCSSNGNGGTSCHTETRTRQVYDYTVHSYHYDAAKAALAGELLLDFLDAHPDMSVDEALQVVSEVTDENKAAILASRGDKAKELTDDEYLSLVNTWAKGSNFTASQPAVMSNHEELENLMASWDATMRASHSQSYITHSHYDSGPAEYQRANEGKDSAEDLSKAAHNIVDGIEDSGAKVPQLSQMVEEYIGGVLYSKGMSKDADDLRKDIVHTAQDIYDSNAGNGFDVHTMKWLNIVLFALLGAAIGGAGGELLSRRLDKSKKEQWIAEDEAADAEEAAEKAARNGAPLDAANNNGNTFTVGDQQVRITRRGPGM